MEQTISQRISARPTLANDAMSLSSGGALPAGTCLREFEIAGTIGEGGFSIVYAALDRQLGREVAIKEYIPSSLAGRAAGHSVHVRSEQHRESFDAGLSGFMNEARLLAQFKHPALVEVLQFWEENGTAYMVMPRYRGKTLRQYLKDRGGACDERWLKRTLNPVLDVLEMLHARSVYHRDIAPDNILVQTDGSAVLLDLGSAREILQDRESSVTVVVKPGYAPLEQYSGEFALPQGPWTDVYAFGALLHFAVTGSPPQASISRVMKDSCVALASSTRPGFSAEFLAAIDAALRLQPAERPQSAMELRSALAMDILPAITAQSLAAASEVLAMLHQDDAITAIVSAEEMADIVEQVARAVAAPGAGQTDAAHASRHADRAGPRLAANASALAEVPAPAAAVDVADPFAQKTPRAEASASSFGDVDDLMSGRLVGTTQDVRVVSESRLESRIDSSQESDAAIPRHRKPLLALASLAGLAVMAVALILWSRSSIETSEVQRTAAVESDETSMARAPQIASADGTRTLVPDLLDPYLPGPSWPVPNLPDGAAGQPPGAGAQFGFPAQQAADTSADSSIAQTPSQYAGSDDWLSGPSPAPSAGMPLDVWASTSAPEAAQEIVVEPQPPLTEVNLDAAPETFAVAPAKPRRAPALNTVAVRINVMPWGEVWVDGKRAGDSPPIKQLDLAPGRYELELRNGSFAPFRQQVDVKANQPLSVEHRFSSPNGG